MIYPWFHVTQQDQAFYDAHLQHRLPRKIFDSHVHMNLEAHIAGVPIQRIQADWALESGLHMDYEAARHYYSVLLPDQAVTLLAFPFPLSEVDIAANNDYLGNLCKLCINHKHNLFAMMSPRPEWNAEYCEQVLLQYPFSGFKPYPYLAAQEKGADISIYDFMPKSQLAVLNKHKRAMVLHLPRHGRLPAAGNIRELLEIRQQYPDIRIILAHLGRCFTPEYLSKGLAALGADRHGFYFDTAAITGKAVFDLALEQLNADQILFGTDQPIFLWHGEQVWNAQGAAVNFAREDFSWNINRKSPAEEAGYPLIFYQQLKNLLDAIGEQQDVKNRIFYENASKILTVNPVL